MKTYFIILVILPMLLFSCLKTDNRLDGLYILEIIEDRYGTFNAERVNIYEELSFNKNIMKTSGKLGDKEFENEYKIKIILTNNEGGTFYSIFSFLSNDNFNNPEKRTVFSYKFVSNDFLLEKENETKLYKRK